MNWKSCEAFLRARPKNKLATLSKRDDTKGALPRKPRCRAQKWRDRVQDSKPLLQTLNNNRNLICAKLLRNLAQNSSVANQGRNCFSLFEKFQKSKEKTTTLLHQDFVCKVGAYSLHPDLPPHPGAVKTRRRKHAGRKHHLDARKDPKQSVCYSASSR